MRERILITGARGFIGLNVVRYFLERNFNVVAFVRSKEFPINNPNLEVEVGDMRNIDSLTQALKGVKFVVHLAGAKQDEKDSFEINVNGAKNLVEACEKNGVNLIVNISTASTKIKEKGVYGETKDKADSVFKESKIPTVTLKPSIVYGDLKNGVFGSIYKFTKLSLTPIFGDGKCNFRPIYVMDLAKVIEIASTNVSMHNKTYDVGGPDLISFDSLVKEVAEKILNKKARIIHVNKKIGLFTAKILSYFFYKAPITRSNILGSTQAVQMDYEAFTKDFNFVPLSLSQGLNLIKKESLLYDEAELMLRYVTSRSIPKVQITERERELYYMVREKSEINTDFDRVVYRYPFILGLLDFISFFNKKGTLYKKIHIATVIVECSPASADWLLPNKRSFFEVGIISIYLLLSFLLKALMSLPLFLFPNFIKRNVI